MNARQTVAEVIATTALAVDIPIDFGDDPVSGVETVLGAIDAVRYVDIKEVGDITSGDGYLNVELYARVTFHFEPDTIEDAVELARERLLTADAVAAMSTFDVESGPYRIEAW